MNIIEKGMQTIIFIAREVCLPNVGATVVGLVGGCVVGGFGGTEPAGRLTHFEFVNVMSSRAMSPAGPLPRSPSNEI